MTLAAAATRASAAGFAATFGPSLRAAPFRAGAGLGAVGGNDLVQLALLEQLGDGAQRQAQGRHGGAQAEGLLDGAGGTHFVIAEANPETAGFPVAAVATTSFAATPLPTAFSSTLTSTALASATPAAEATVLLALGAG